MVSFVLNATRTTQIYTLSLHDALPISGVDGRCGRGIEKERAHRSRKTSERRPARSRVCAAKELPRSVRRDDGGAPRVAREGRDRKAEVGRGERPGPAAVAGAPHVAAEVMG